MSVTSTESQPAPLVSVVMAMYNDQTHVIRAIKSVEEQTYTNWEFVITDDCSKDGTYETVEAYVRNNPKIRLLRNEVNAGTYVSLNNCLKNVTGDYITNIDSDDWFLPMKLEVQVAAMLAKPGCIVSWHAWEREQLKKTSMEGTIMYHKRVLTSVGYYDSVRFGGDTEFCKRIMRVFGKLKSVFIPQMMYHATYRPGSLTSSPSINKNNPRSVYSFRLKKWHQAYKVNLYMPFPAPIRPFEVPEIMSPTRPAMAPTCPPEFCRIVFDRQQTALTTEVTQMLVNAVDVEVIREHIRVRIAENKTLQPLHQKRI